MYGAPSSAALDAKTPFWCTGWESETGSRGATRPHRSASHRGRVQCPVCCVSSADSLAARWCTQKLHSIPMPCCCTSCSCSERHDGQSDLRSMFGNSASVKSLTTSKPRSLRYLRKTGGSKQIKTPVVLMHPSKCMRAGAEPNRTTTPKHLHQLAAHRANGQIRWRWEEGGTRA